MAPVPWVASGFEPVETAFRHLQDREEELGSAVCVYLDGQPVVDLWAGYALPSRNVSWRRDTVVSVFSASKALTALCLLHLVDRNRAGLDDAVVEHWPEFARTEPEAKNRVTLRHILTHSAGLPVIRNNRVGDVYNWPRMIAALENARLVWEAGSRTAYHAVTFGHLAGEVIRRISGQMPSRYFAEHFSGPLGLDLSLKLLPDQADRLALCDGDSWKNRFTRASLTYVAPWFSGWQAQYFRPCGADYHPNSRRWQSAEAPAITGFGTAEGLARFYAMLAGGGVLDGVRVLSEDMVRRVTRERPEPVKDHGIGHDVRVGLGLYYNLGPMADLGPNPNSVGHVGMGGVTSFADPDARIGFGYVCNHLYQPTAKSTTLIGDRAARLVDVLYDCLRDRTRP
ncbi:MAG: serine hydrolase domain-containing protein [Pseudomonadota bacterium]